MLRPALFLMAAAVALASAVPTSASDAVAGASDYDAAIARLEQRDPQDPQALNARLQYADLLADAGGAPPQDCHARLDAAQAQLDTVAARPATAILLPLGQAKLDSGAYKIHAARADCDAATRTGELRKALDAATKAAREYEDGLDYQSAAVMQFNIAVARHDLGDSAGAIAALQAAIATDREFAFRDDALDNIRLLQRWQGGDDSDAHVAALMQDFPAPRTAQFKFAWAQSDAHVSIAAHETVLVGARAVDSTGAIALERHIRQNGSRFVVMTDPGTADIRMGDWPAGHENLNVFAAHMLMLALLETPSYQVHNTGDFEMLRDGRAFSTALLAEIGKDLQDSPTNDIKDVLRPGNIETSTAMKYSLHTATWAGATMQQGVWYRMTAPLALSGLGLGQLFLVTHDIEFSYARPVACTPGDTTRDCAEIVIHATPDPADLAKAHIEMSSLFHMETFDSLHHWSSINLRLVLKPDTLMPYLSDMRRSWYVDIDGATEPMIASERVVTTSVYH